MCNTWNRQTLSQLSGEKHWCFRRAGGGFQRGLRLRPSKRNEKNAAEGTQCSDSLPLSVSSSRKRAWGGGVGGGLAEESAGGRKEGHDAGSQPFSSQALGYPHLLFHFQ